MVVRLRFRHGPKIRRKPRKNGHVALALSSLLTPAALIALTLAFWRLGTDLRVAAQFVIRDGLFSHWQVWMAIALVVQIVAVVLNRYGRGQALLPQSGKEPATLLDSHI
jgi:hypothetical protein